MSYSPFLYESFYSVFLVLNICYMQKLFTGLLARGWHAPLHVMVVFDIVMLLVMEIWMITQSNTTLWMMLAVQQMKWYFELFNSIWLHLNGNLSIAYFLSLIKSIHYLVYYSHILCLLISKQPKNNVCYKVWYGYWKITYVGAGVEIVLQQQLCQIS